MARALGYYGRPPFRLFAARQSRVLAVDAAYARVLQELRTFRAGDCTKRLRVLVEPTGEKVLESLGLDWRLLISADPRFPVIELEANYRGVERWRAGPK
jgi:hypothetical protein